MATPIADMIERMFAEGAPLAAVLTAVRAMELSSDVVNDSRDDKDDRRRERDRLWHRKHREKQRLLKGGAKANDVAPVVQMSPSTSDDMSSLRRISSSTELVVEHRGNQEEGLLLPELVEGQKEKKVSRGTRITRDWWPDEATLKFCADQGWRLFEIDRGVAEFIDYWIAIPGHRGTKLDWNSTFRNRVRATTHRSNGYGKARQHPSDLALELAAEARELERQAGISR